MAQGPTIGSSTGRANLKQIGAINAATGLSVVEDKFGHWTRSTFTLTAVAFTITDTLAYLGTKIYDFPEGIILLGGAVGRITMSVTSANTTLNDAAVVTVGVGTATASNIALTSTMVNAGLTSLTMGTNPAASAAGIIRPVLGTATAASLTSLNTVVDGSGTAADLFLNFGVPTNTEIDGDATVTVTGTITVLWCNILDV